MLSIVGRDHVISRRTLSAPDKSVPFGWSARLLILGEPNGTGSIYWPLFDYFLAHWTRSDAWQVGVARALGLFWDYSGAYLSGQGAPGPSDWFHRELIRGFGRALVNGTIRNCRDPLGLFWAAQSVQTARRLVCSIEQFIDWRAKEGGLANPYAACPRNMSVEDRMTASALSVRRQGFSLLGYLTKPQSSRPSIVDLPKLGRHDSTAMSAPISFPASKVEEVLWKGFRRSGDFRIGFEHYDLRSMMIFLLQGFAGLREHEPFHLWVNDICEDPLNPGRACVFLYHPSEGLAYFDGRSGRPIRCTRKEKLEKDYSLPARTHGSGAYRIGWKKSKVETKDYYAVLYWTDPTAAVLFLVLFRTYLQRRSQIMTRRLALGFGDHPFLFVSEREDRNSPDGAKFIGAPASIESYEVALERAVTSCGLIYGKPYGTTSHGLRHLYAYTLRKLGVSTKILQEGLRHASPTSSYRYGIPFPYDVSEALRKAAAERPDALPVELSLDRCREWTEKHFPTNAHALA